jgi:hypothetical protein
MAINRSFVAIGSTFFEVATKYRAFSFGCQAPDPAGENLAFSQEVSSSRADLEEGLRAGPFCGRLSGPV